MKLLVVESPNKVSKIQGYLDELQPGSWRVVATVGHWRGLPSMDGLAFADAVDPTSWNERFAVHKDDVAARLGAAIKQAQGVYLATDPDREGEAIAWHVVDHFKLRGAHRVLFTEITKAALSAALERAGQLDTNLVEAQRARQVLDYEFGLEVSRRLWRFGCKSAGRVQSAALRILVDRENAIRAFKPTDFWNVVADYGDFTASVAVFERMSIEEVDDAGVDAGDVVRLKPQRFATKAEAEAIVAAGRTVQHVVERIDSKPTTRRPPPPFTTSTLQAEASTRLRWDPDKTARVAQSLFEDGLVTYIRTDSTALADEAIAELRDYLRRSHPALLPKDPQRYADKAGAQGAHEAIRPIHVENPDAASLKGDDKALYDLILTRTIACQAASAVIERTVVVIEPKGQSWRLQAQGAVIRTPGFLSLQTVPDGTESAAHEPGLPALTVGARLQLQEMRTDSGRTKPPPRFTHASLIRYLERVRIGRPSTYAAILSTLLDRDYAKKQKQHLVPTDHGELADRLTRVSFDVLTQETFTSTTEKSLDKIADGALVRTTFLSQFHRGLSQMLDASTGHLADYATRHPELDRDAVRPHDSPCPNCGAARVRRAGKFGEYAQCSQQSCGKRENLEQLKELADPCPDCASIVVEQPYSKDGRKAVFYRCSSCAWRSSYKPPRITKWPCHVDAAHGCMVEVTYEKEGKKRHFFKCRHCENKAWTGPKPPPCPLCGTAGMRLLDGPKGPFWGCAAYRETGCKGVAAAEETKPRPKPVRKPPRPERKPSP